MKVFTIILGLGLAVSCTEIEPSIQKLPVTTLSSSITNVSFKPEVKIETSKKFQGIWETRSSGAKVKWKIDGDKLYKNMIYSFGEIGEPKVFDIDFKNSCEGVPDAYGRVMIIKDENRDEKKFICYNIYKLSENKIVLHSKFGSKIELTRK